MGQPAQISFAFYFSGTLALLVLAVAVVGFFFNYQKKIQKQQELSHAKEKAHQKSLLEAVLEAQEKERKRIGRDLHDGVGVLLSLAKIQLEAIPRTADGYIQDREVISEVTQKLTEVINSTRSISHDLLPAAVTRIGLVEALETLLSNVTTVTGIETDLFADDLTVINLEEKHAITIYRMVQELLNNSLKHGKPNEIRLDIEITNDMLFMVYHDNGLGVDLNTETVKKNGHGLKNIESRVILLNGQIEVDTAPGRGFCTRIFIPLPIQAHVS